MKDNLNSSIIFVLTFPIVLGLIFALMFFGEHYIILGSITFVLAVAYLCKAFIKLNQAKDSIDILLWSYWFYRIPAGYILICFFVAEWNGINFAVTSINLVFISSIAILYKLMGFILKRRGKLK